MKAIKDANILIVDDTRIMRSLMARLLEQLGYTSIAQVEHGKDALDYVDANPVDLIILDIMMPEMDGYQTLENLKAKRHLDKLAVVMVTAVEEIESVAKCIELGASDYMPKLFNPILFDSRIQGNLRLLFSQQLLAEHNLQLT